MSRSLMMSIAILGFSAVLSACAPTNAPVSPTPDTTVSPSPDVTPSPTPTTSP